MSFSFTHLIAAWLCGKLYEFISKKKISHYIWFFLLFGAILPDADYLLDWTLGTQIHRTFTHSIVFVIAAPLLLYFILYLISHSQKKGMSLALGVGITTHLLLDYLGGGNGIPLLWPSLFRFSIDGMSYGIIRIPLLEASRESLRNAMKDTIKDMALGTTWIFYLWWRKKLKF